MPGTQKLLDLDRKGLLKLPKNVVDPKIRTESG